MRRPTPSPGRPLQFPPPDSPLAPADPEGWKYIFTQQHRDEMFFWNGLWVPQTVPTNSRIQVQLPGDPIRWYNDADCSPSSLTTALESATTEYLGSHILPNPERIEGTSAIYVFDYRVTSVGATAICLRPDPVPNTSEELGFPPGTPKYYVLTLTVGIPQLSLP